VPIALESAPFAFRMRDAQVPNAKVQVSTMTPRTEVVVGRHVENVVRDSALCAFVGYDEILLRLERAF
jgi:hypothetical protein